MKKLLSLFSGCGGMDIGFEGGFNCLKRSVNTKLHPDWVDESNEPWVKLATTDFETVFANDIRPDAKIAWVYYFSAIQNSIKEKTDADKLYHSVVFLSSYSS